MSLLDKTMEMETMKEGDRMHELTEVEEEVIRIIEQRNQKGRETYGKGLEFDDNYDWLDMAIEEAADMLKYLVAEKLRRRRCIPNKVQGNDE